MSNKVLLQKGHLYIKCPQGGQAWLKPTVEVNRLPTNCYIELMTNSEKPHNVWTTYFNSVEARGTQQLWAITGLSVNGSDNSSWEEVEVPGVENFKKARDNLQTPRRLKLAPLLVAAVESSPSATGDLQSIAQPA
jgi:hypothetical protein